MEPALPLAPVKPTWPAPSFLPLGLQGVREARREQSQVGDSPQHPARVWWGVMRLHPGGVLSPMLHPGDPDQPRARVEMPPRLCVTPGGLHVCKGQNPVPPARPPSLPLRPPPSDPDVRAGSARPPTICIPPGQPRWCRKPLRRGLRAAVVPSTLYPSTTSLPFKGRTTRGLRGKHCKAPFCEN